MDISDDPTATPLPLWQLLSFAASGDLSAQRIVVDHYQAETFERPDYEQVTFKAELWARAVVANSRSYADVPALINCLISRHDAALYLDEDKDKAKKVAVEIAALADLISENCNDNSAIEDFGICVDYPSDEVRREAAALKEHWMLAKFTLGQIVFTEQQ